jgi:hypothetical protein
MRFDSSSFLCTFSSKKKKKKKKTNYNNNDLMKQVSRKKKRKERWGFIYFTAHRKLFIEEFGEWRVSARVQAGQTLQCQVCFAWVSLPREVGAILTGHRR